LVPALTTDFATSLDVAKHLDAPTIQGYEDVITSAWMAGIDRTLHNLLALDGETFVLHPDGYWVKFKVKSLPVSAGRPHGLDYSLTLHGPDGERLMGFDNAHLVPPKKHGDPYDHRHPNPNKSKPYDYTDATELLKDFWTAVDDTLRTRGITP
jgi:uncharacterized protein DUF6516